LGHTCLRIFDIAKADEFYQGFLGFSVDWDHRFDPKRSTVSADIAGRPYLASERSTMVMAIPELGSA